jgi:hypothetical protein
VVHPVRLSIANVDEVASGYDLVIDGTDSFPTRYLVNDSCVCLGVPLVWGSIFQFDAQVAAFWRRPPLGSGALAVQLRDLFPAPPPAGSVPSCSEGWGAWRAARAGWLGHGNRTVNLLTGAGAALLGRVLVLDGLEGRWTQIPLVTDTTRSSSPLPSEDDLEDRCGVGAGSGRGVAGLDLCVATLTAHQLKDRLADRAAGGEALLLVDVREPAERAIVTIPGAQCRATWRDPGRQRPRGHPPRPTGRAVLPQRGGLRTGCPQAPVCRIWGCRPPGGRRPGLDRPGRPEFTRH